MYRRKRRTTRNVWRVSAAHAPLTTHSPRRTLAAHGIHVVYMLLSSSRMYQRSPYDVVIHVRRTAVQCVSVLTAAGYLLAPADMRRPEVEAVVQDWVNDHPGEECSASGSTCRRI